MSTAKDPPKERQGGTLTRFGPLREPPEARKQSWLKHFAEPSRARRGTPSHDGRRAVDGMVIAGNSDATGVSELTKAAAVRLNRRE